MKLLELYEAKKAKLPEDVLADLSKTHDKDSRPYGGIVESELSKDGNRAVVVRQMGSVGSGGLRTKYMTSVYEKIGDAWKHRGTIASDYKKAWVETMGSRHVPTIIAKHLKNKEIDTPAVNK